MHRLNSTVTVLSKSHQNLSNEQRRERRKKEVKRLKMTTFDESVKRCGCKKKCGADFADEHLIKTREDYSYAGSFEKQNMIVANLIERNDKARCSLKIGTEPKRNNRKYTISYNLKDAENDYRQVCQTMFLQTLGITVIRVRTVLKNKHVDLSFKHGGQPRNKISNDVHDLILEHLHCLPTVPVHYRRAENKRYFEDDITLGILYKLFKEWMKNTNKRKVENPHNDQISIETVYWETAKLIELEKGSSIITISDTYNIGDGKQVDTKMKPTIRTPRKRSKEILGRCQEMPRDGIAASLQ